MPPRTGPFNRSSRSSPPAVKNRPWVQSPVDAFVLARLEAAGLTPSPPADKRTSDPPRNDRSLGHSADGRGGRRVSRPTSHPMRSPALVDRLLASPRYGERWGRHWLDVARYADTKGYVFTQDRRYPYAYTYRDYVITAFNADLGYDQFMIEQIAADQLAQGNDPRPLAAMGFLTVGRRFLLDQNEIIDDRIDVVSRGFWA